MSKISIYEVAPVPKLADKLVGTSVGGEPEDITYNFTLSELLNLFIPNIPGNTLQGVLNFGNTATQNINLTGIITTTTLNVGSTANILNSNLTGQTKITGGLYDRLNSIGTAGQVLRSTGTQVEWYSIPNVIPTLQQVLASGNTADINVILTSNIQALTATANNVVSNTSLSVNGTLKDKDASVGTAGQLLSSTGTKVQWVDLPVYTATSPLSINSITRNISIQQASSTQNGYLSSADWITFDGKQGAVSLTTVGSSGPATLVGSVINVPNYTLSGLGGVPQTRTLTINGVTYNLAADRSWTLATGVSSVTATTPLSSTGGANPNISIQQSSSSLSGYLSSTDWLMFNDKQPAGNYITSLTGEATGAGPGAASVTLSNAAVIGKLLTGLNITGGTVVSTDSILTGFGKLQNQINSLVGGVIYKGVWNAATNTPTLVSSVGVQGNYYIVSVAGNTDLNGITSWNVGDWAIFNGSTWNKVDNTDAVTSVNGQTGAVSLTTDNIPEGATNLYYLDSRARAALSFAAGSGAYNSTTGVITIPTDNSQILNGAGYITLVSLSATSPLSYNNLTGAFSIQVANTTQNGYLSSADWNTFNGKQDYLNGTGLVKSVAGTISYITDNSANWNTAYNDSIISAAVTGTATKTLTLNQQDGGTITASWSDIDTGLTSVGVSMPAAFSVANSPLTSNGTIAVTGAGTTLQYIDGTGALQNFPGLTGYVPYTGANQNVDLGEFGISAGYFQADLTPTGALQVGRMQWNSTDGTMDLRLMGNNVTLQIGQENVTRVVNKSGVNLLEANYQVVRIRKVAEGGAQGQRLAVVLAQGNNENNSTEVIGLVTETINNNQEGFVTAFGEVKQINTTGSLQGETWVDGDILYLSSTVAGALTNVRPVAPNHAVIVGYVTYAHANNGKIYMAIDTGYELGELHNVYAPSPTANQSIYWDTTNSRYQLNTIGGILGYTPANAATTISTTAPLQGGGDLSANRTFSITQSGASTNGYLSSTDWNTFNDKQPLITAGTTLQYYRGDKTFQTLNTTVVPEGTNLYYLDSRARAAISLTTTGSSGAATYNSTTGVFNIPDYGSALSGYVPTSRQLTINGTAYDLSADRSWSVGTVTSVAALTLGTTGTDLSSSVATGTTTPVITLNVPTASAANRGALSAADWSTFNTKVGGVTASSPLASSGGSTPNITIQQSSGSQDGYLSSTDWTIFNSKQAAGNYITSLTGEATATGPGAAAVTLNNASVTGKVLTGVNITGGTVQATDTMLTAFGKLQNQINGLIGSTIYQGTWNAATNTPALASGVGVQGYYYIVSVAGTTNLDGITDWFVGDWAIFNGGVWQQVDNTDAVVSVNGQTGAVSLTTDNIPEGATNQYYLDSRARAALSFTAGSGAYNSTTGVITIPTNTSQLTNGANFITLASLSGTAPIVYSNITGAISITQSGTASNGYLSSTDWNTFNNKQATITLTTTGTSGAATLVGATLNIPQYQSALTNPVTGTGNANYIPKFTGTSAIANSVIYDNSGNILIGTGNLTSAHKLTVYSATETAQFRAAGAAPAIAFTNTDTNTNSYVGYLGMATAVNNFITGAAAGDFVLHNYSGGPILFGINNSEKVRIASSGIATFKGSGNRPVTIDSGINIKGESGGWAMQYSFLGSSGTARGGFGALGSADSLTYFYVGIYGSEKLTIDNATGLASFAGAITATGNITGAYILGSYFNASAGNSENPTIGQVWTQSTGDNYLRKSTPAHFRSQVTDGYYVPSTSQTTWNSSTVIGNVVGLLAWKNYGNNHVIFDASQSISPSGTAVNSTNPSSNWVASYPTLMGWNGAGTYGVRVDSARVADSAGSATTTTGNAGSVTYLPNRTDSAAYEVLWGAPYTNTIGTTAHSCAAITIQSSTGTLQATNLYATSLVTARTNGDYRQATLGAITGAGLFITPASANTYGLLVGSSYTYGDVWLQASRTDGIVSAYNISLNASGGTVTVGTVAPQSGYNLTVSGAGYFSSGLMVNTSGTGTWGPFVVTSTSLWGDGATQYVTIGAGGAAGIMIYNPHIVWNASEATAAAKYGRSGGISSGAYYVAGTGASDNFFIAKNGTASSPQFNINSSGNATFSGTITSSNFSGSSSGTNTGDQTNISGNAATVTHNASRTDSALYNVGWFAGNPSPAYSCDAVQIQSSTGTLYATNLSATRSYAAMAPTVSNGNWVTSFQATPVSAMAWGGDVSAGGPLGTWWFQVNMRHSNASSTWGTQLAYGWEDNANEIYQRNVTGGNWSGWVRYLNSNNYNLFALPLTGGNLSGTLTFSQPVGLGFANGQYVKDNGSGGFVIYGAALIQLNSDVQTSNYMLVGGNYSNNGYNSVASTRLMFGGGNADAQGHYYIGTNLNNYGGNYTKLDLAWHTGIRMGSQPSYGGIRFFNSENLSTQIFSVGETDDNVRVPYKLSVGTQSVTNQNLTVYSATGAGQVRIGGAAPTIYFTNVLTDPATYVGLLGLATSSNNFFTGTAAGDFVMYNSASGYNLFVVNFSGGVYLTSGATSWTANSDIRLKNINSHIENAVEKLSTLQTINFSYKDDKFKKQNLGLIAQEVEKIFPELIDKNNDGMLGVRYTELVPVLIKAIQELKLEIETLKNK